jgi:protein SCO1/2
MGRSVAWTAAAAVLTASLSGCSQTPPPKRYPLTGQVIAVNAVQQTITIKHEDIPNYMPGMTMSFPVVRADLLNNRTPGELVKAVLEVSDSAGKIAEITHTGTAPLPSENETAMAAGVLDVGGDVPDAALIDQFDKRRSISEWKGGLTLITFIYTTCPLPNFCPLMDQNFATIQRQVAEDPALKGKVKLISISFDPERDTPAVLKAHAAKFKADPAVWTFLTGDRVTIDRFAAKFGVGVVREGAGPASIAHNLRTALIGTDGKILRIYGGSDWTPSAALADLRAAATPAHR